MDQLPPSVLGQIFKYYIIIAKLFIVLANWNMYSGIKCLVNFDTVIIFVMYIIHCYFEYIYHLYLLMFKVGTNKHDNI